MSLIVLKDLSLIRGATLFTGLHIMSGEEEATMGSVTRARRLVVAFAAQDPPEFLLSLSFHDAVRDALAPEVAEAEIWRVDILLDDLAVDEALRGRVG